MNYNRLSDRAVATILKNRANAVGIAPENISGHSLRAGLATSAAQQGISTHKIRAQTGHTSDTMLNRYIRDGNFLPIMLVGCFSFKTNSFGTPEKKDRQEFC